MQRAAPLVWHRAKGAPVPIADEDIDNPLVAPARSDFARGRSSLPAVTGLSVEDGLVHASQADNPVIRWPHPVRVRGQPSRVQRRSRRLLLTTSTLEAAIAAPAIIGLSSPAIASGIAAML